MRKEKGSWELAGILVRNKIENLGKLTYCFLVICFLSILFLKKRQIILNFSFPGVGGSFGKVAGPTFGTRKIRTVQNELFPVFAVGSSCPHSLKLFKRKCTLIEQIFGGDYAPILRHL